MSRTIAVVTSGRAYEAICTAIRTRCDEVGMSRAMLDAAAGLPEHNAAKLLAPVPDKRMLAETLLRMLDSIEMDIVLVERPGGRERIAETWGQRKDSRVRNNNMRSVLRIRKKAKLERIFTDPNFFRKIGRNGNRARNKSMDKEARHKSASFAARSRWRRVRQRRIAARCAPAPQASI